MVHAARRRLVPTRVDAHSTMLAPRRLKILEDSWCRPEGELRPCCETERKLCAPEACARGVKVEAARYAQPCQSCLTTTERLPVVGGQKIHAAFGQDSNTFELQRL